jgi:hypothetical protein
MDNTVEPLSESDTEKNARTMPIEGSKLLTNVQGTKQYQDVLFLAKREPHLVERVWIDQDMNVLVKFDPGPTMRIGVIKDKYRFLAGRKLHVQSWNITGGVPLYHYARKEGTPLTYLGCNLQVIIVGQEVKLSTPKGVLAEAV